MADGVGSTGAGKGWGRSDALRVRWDMQGGEVELSVFVAPTTLAPTQAAPWLG